MHPRLPPWQRPDSHRSRRLSFVLWPKGFSVVSACLLHALLWSYWYHRLAVEPPKAPQVMEVSLVSRPKPVAAQPEPPKPAPKPPQRTRPVPAKRAPAKAAPVLPAKAIRETPPQRSTAPETSATPLPVPEEPAVYKADYLRNPPPPYPIEAKWEHWQGEVLIRVRVLEDGSPDEVRLERSSGQEVLDEAALDAVRRWRFVPAKQGEQPVASTVIVPIEFRLDG